MAILTSYTPYKDGDVLTPDVLNDVVETAINANKITQTPDTSMVNQVGTPSVSIASDGRLIFANLKGEQGNPGSNGTNAGFGTINATTDYSVGTPKVVVLTSGDNSAKNITFQFQNIKGEQGEPGTSISHYWNGTTLVLSSASGTSSANLKGDKGDKGDKGEQGIQGIPGSSDMAFLIDEEIYNGSGVLELYNSNITQGWYLIGFKHTFYDDEGYEEESIVQRIPIMITQNTSVRYYAKLNFSNSYQNSRLEVIIHAEKGLVYVDTTYTQSMQFNFLARLK